MLLVLGCGASAPIAVAPATTSTPPTDACAGQSGLVLEVPDAIPSEWSGAVVVGGSGTATTRWCGEGIVSVDRLELGTESGAGMRWDFDPTVTRLAHGEGTAREIRGSSEPGDQSLRAFAHDDAGREIVASAVVHSVTDPAFTAARDACLARAGTFAPAGMAQIFTCDAPTHDGGRRCLSNDDCEGVCIEDHVEVTSAAPDGRSCAAGEETRLHVGTCARTTSHFGCIAQLVTVTTECVPPDRMSSHQIVCSD
jgi:hypothetical protein